MNARLPAAVTAAAALAATPIQANAAPSEWDSLHQANALTREFSPRQATAETRQEHAKKCLGWWAQMYTDYGGPKNVNFTSPTEAIVDVNLIDMRDPTEDPMAKECEDVDPIDREVRVVVTQGSDVNVDSVILDSTREPDDGTPIRRALPVLKPLKDGPYKFTFRAIAESPEDKGTVGAQTYSESQDRTFKTPTTPTPPT